MDANIRKTSLLLILILACLTACSQLEVSNHNTSGAELDVFGEAKIPLVERKCLFYPVYKQDGPEPYYQLGNSRVSFNEAKKITFVFNQYNIDYQQEGAFFIIPCYVMGDIDYIYNLTKKSGIKE